MTHRLLPALQIMQASFGSSIRSLFGQQYTLSIASPADGCKAFNNTGNVANTVVLVLRGSCYFAVKVRTICHAPDECRHSGLLRATHRAG